VATPNQTPDNRDRDDRVVLTPNEARQATLGRPVLYVLVVALILALLAWMAVGYWGRSIDPNSEVNTTAGSVTAPVNNTVSDPVTEPARENPAVVDDNPAPGVERQTEPVIVDPQPTNNQ
jgi:hypothetical protein